ncbi:MAG TPA: hypothetical protein VGX76_05030, partial [Pirellulales bacterium]|nr:hypothetical protein [Pirellulales bacterium]
MIEREHEAVPDELRGAQRAVQRRLAVVRRALRMHLLAEGVFWLTCTLFVAAAVTLVLDLVFRFNLSTRLGLLAVAVAAILWIAARRLVRPLLLPLDNLDLAELLDRRVRGVGQHISNVLQLPELLAHRHYASSSMVHAAVVQCAASLERVDLVATLDAERRRKLLLATGALVLLAASFSVLWPQTARLWARRWLAGSNVRWPQNTYLSVGGLGEGMKLLVPRGEIALVRIDARPHFGGAPNQWILTGRGEPLVVEGIEAPQSQPPEQVSISYRLADGSPRRGNATQYDETNFRYELPPLAEAVDLYITGGDDWLGPITVEPIDRPAISELEITALRPGASVPRTERVGEGTTQLLYLSETKLQLRLVANEPLASAEALDKGLPVGLWRRVDERAYTLDWTMKDSLALEFRLVGRLGGLASKPYFLAIGLLKDREPRVTIQSSGVGRRVTPVARIPLSLRATDDFGVASLALDWERTATRDDKPHVE